MRKYVILSWKFDKIFELVLWYFAYLFYMKFTLNQKIQKFGIGNPKFRGISQWEILMIAESLDNHMNDMRIYANWRVSNSRNSEEKSYACDFKSELRTFCFQHWRDVYSTGDCQSINLMKFLDISLILWSIFKFFDFSLTFLVSFQIPWLFSVFQVAWQPWSMDCYGTLFILWQ